jgi:adenylate cyclase
MAHEIERKFLVKNDDWRKLATGERFRQGYLSTTPERTVRVRVVGDQGSLTIKGITKGVSRVEYEYPIPFSDAEHMLNELCERPLIEKLRHKIEIDNLVWEIDEYEGENYGLVIAEVELDHEEQDFHLPDWIGQEVSDDARYFNANLVANPYRKWRT